jgi:hypothetical protein
VVKRAYSRDAVSAAGEYGAQFRSDISGFLDFEVVDGAVDRGVLVRPPRAGIAYRSGCDMSGGSHDSSVLSICHSETSPGSSPSSAESTVEVLDALLEIRPPFNPTSAVEQMAALLGQYGLSSTTGDRYAAGWIPDAFSKQNIAYSYSERDRSQCYLDVLPLFMSGRLKLIDNQKLVSQFVGLERRSTIVGRDKVDQDLPAMTTSPMRRLWPCRSRRRATGRTTLRGSATGPRLPPMACPRASTHACTCVITRHFLEVSYGEGSET